MNQPKDLPNLEPRPPTPPSVIRSAVTLPTPTANLPLSTAQFLPASDNDDTSDEELAEEKQLADVCYRPSQQSVFGEGQD